MGVGAGTAKVMRGTEAVGSVMDVVAPRPKFGRPGVVGGPGPGRWAVALPLLLEPPRGRRSNGSPTMWPMMPMTDRPIEPIRTRHRPTGTWCAGRADAPCHTLNEDENGTTDYARVANVSNPTCEVPVTCRMLSPTPVTKFADLRDRGETEPSANVSRALEHDVRL